MAPRTTPPPSLEMEGERRENRWRTNGEKWRTAAASNRANYRPLIDAASRSLRVYH